ncbi:hypothetical protein SAV14893_088620 [Streptomyces avermitilis]|uniref:Uncharacterized protein n=1 Tax=Streptomyces avermitilis TaxID=33903 RepID=A0A4D4MCY1_STRAX|nr:hypothetical protein SAVMC3_07910 [Streptomyces avermitilis]GDY69469.1 hypothetical protein SAV14893_088620 [Streptomyces avermitilis]GDY79719.1 hypothetical protein SAV31267_092040 [Streptomyces avermitilis]
MSSAATGTCSRTSPEPSFVPKGLQSAEYAATARVNARAGPKRSAAAADVVGKVVNASDSASSSPPRQFGTDY